MHPTSNANDGRGRARRAGAIAVPVLAGALVLVSCGGGETGATQSTIDLSASSTAFVVRPPATTEPPSATDAVDPDAIVEGTQEYVVQPNDAPYVIVNRFGVSLEDLIAVNEWGSEAEFPWPGETILIPPGGRSVEAVAAGTASGGAASTGGQAAPPADTIPDAGDNCAPGSYTIAENDFEGKVAKKFDVTLDALRAANAATPGYAAFYVGLEIVIPAKTNC